MPRMTNRCGPRRLWWGFFFQAEDGIRDLTVTGVQTCALPISRGRACATPGDVDMSGRPVRRRVLADVEQAGGWPVVLARIASGEPVVEIARTFRVRSEESRVGKEGRSRWAPYH